MEENKEAYDVYMAVRSQHIMGFGGPIDLNFSSVNFVMDMMGVKDKKKCFDKVYKVYKVMLEKILKEIEQNRETK